MKRLNRTVLLVLAMLLLAALCVFAVSAEEVASGTCGKNGDNLTWTLDDAGVLTISGTGSMADYSTNSTSRPSFDTYKESIISIVFNDGVTRIGHSAFYQYSSVESLSFPNSLTEIGQSSFYGLSSLLSLQLPSGIKTIAYAAFQGCGKIASLFIPSSVNNIGQSAFANCSMLSVIQVEEGNTKYLVDEYGCLYNASKTFLFQYPVASDNDTYTIPSTVTEIGQRAFSKCTSIKHVYIPESVISINRAAFASCVGIESIELPESLQSLETEAFSGCSSLTNISIPESITIINSSTFSNCSSLERVELTENVTKLDSRAFYGCSALEDISLPAGLKSIGGSCFYDCLSLSNISIPSGVTVIADQTFRNCNALQSVEFQGNVTNIGVDAFNTCKSLTNIVLPESVRAIGARAFQLCSSLQTIDIPYGVETITTSCFNGCTSLEHISIPDTVTMIGLSTFRSCQSLTTLELPKNLVTLQGMVFDGCSKIEEIVLPDSLQTLGYDTFGGCRSIKSIVIPESVTSIQDTVFNNCSSLSEVTMSNSIKSIGYLSFGGCSKIESIRLSTSMKSIGDRAFGGCAALQRIYTCMTDDEWETVSLHENWKRNGTLIKNAHETDSVTWNWAADKLSATAAFTCKHCGQDLEWPATVTTSFKDGYLVASASIDILDDTFTDEVNVMRGGYCGGVGDGTNLWWTLDDAGKLTIDGEGAMATYSAWSNYNPPWTDYRSLITEIWICEDVSTIGNEAFNYCSSASLIHLSSGIRSVAGSAFYGCSGRQVLEIDSENPVYYVQDNCLINRDTKMLILGCNDSIIPDDANVLTIGIDAFNYCQEMQSFVIPEGVVSINHQAFSACISLESVDLPDSLENLNYGAFISCKSLKRITIPSSVTELGKHIFNSCLALEEVYLRYGTTVIGDSAFRNCTSLQVISLPSSLTKIGAGAFSNCTSLSEIRFPNALSEIGQEAFYNIPKSSHMYSCVTQDEWDTVSLGENWVDGTRVSLVLEAHETDSATWNWAADKLSATAAFTCKHCGQELEWPATVTTSFNDGYLVASASIDILDDTFTDEVNVMRGGYCGGASGGKNLWWTLDDAGTLTIDGEGAMAGYNVANSVFAPWYGFRAEIQTVVINSGVTSIGGSAFQNCTALESVSIAQGVTAIGVNAFNGCKALTEVEIPAGVKYLNNGVFSFCSNLASVSIPSTVETIGNSTFSYCPALASVTIPESVTGIGTMAFCGCTKLESILIPAGVTNIGVGAFAKCSKMETLQVDPENTAYASNGNCIIRIDSNTLIAGCKTSVIPTDGSVEKIAAYAFNGIPLKAGFEIPGTVTTIDKYAFLDASGLTKIRIPNSVTSIGAGAMKITGLQTIQTCRTQSDWEQNVTADETWKAQTATLSYAAHLACAAVIEREVPATCSENGSYDSVVYCGVCGEELERDTIPTNKLEHTPGEATIENVIEASCGRPGSFDTVVRCSVCGEELNRVTTRTEMASDHDWTIKSATWSGNCDTVTVTFVCGNCGVTQSAVFDRSNAELKKDVNAKTKAADYTISFTFEGQPYTLSKHVPGPYRCGMCDFYDSHKNAPIYGWLIVFIHNFVHMASMIGRAT